MRPTQAQSIADDKLDAMIEIKKDLRRFFNKAREQSRDVGISTGSWINMVEVVEQAIDDMLSDSWHKNREISGRIDYTLSPPLAYSLNVRPMPPKPTVSEHMEDTRKRIKYVNYLQTNRGACLSFEEWKEGR